MNMNDLSDQLLGAVRDYTKRHTEALAARVQALEARTPLDGTPGRDGERGPAGADGKSVSLEEVAALIDAAVRKAFDAMPKPKDGEPGRAGKDGANGVNGKDAEPVSLDVVSSLIAGEVAKQVSAIKVKDGADGRDGKDGTNGKDGKDADPLYVEKLVTAAVAAIPKPENGKDGADGLHGKDGANGINGKDGANGKDGRDVNDDEIIARVLKAIPTPKDGRDGIDGTSAEVDYNKIVRDVLAEIPEPRDGRDGPRGQKGEPGRDGFGFESMSGEQIDDRTFALKFVSGTEQKVFPIYIPSIIYRGLYEQKDYERNDTVTYGGSTWIAKRDARPSDKPGDSDAWQLAVKRGRDGKSE